MAHSDIDWDKLYRPVSEHEAPHLHAAVDEFCQRLGMAKPKVCFFDSAYMADLVRQGKQTRLEQFQLERCAAAVDYKNPRILFGDLGRESMGHFSAGAPISDEFKSVIAHELGHIKRGDLKHFTLIERSPYLCAVAAMGGLWLYEECTKKADAMRLAGHSEQEVKEGVYNEWNASYPAPSPAVKSDDTLGHQMASVGKYLAAGALGIGVGLMTFRGAHHAAEFGADKISAELMGSGKHFADHLRNSKIWNKSNPASTEVMQEVRKDFAKMNWVEKMKYGLTHPSDKARIDRLEAFAR